MSASYKRFLLFALLCILSALQFDILASHKFVWVCYFIGVHLSPVDLSIGNSLLGKRRLATAEPLLATLWCMIFTTYIVLAGEPGRPELFILLVLFTLPNAEMRVLFTQ
jgi:hypothetical protein